MITGIVGAIFLYAYKLSVVLMVPINNTNTCKPLPNFPHCLLHKLLRHFMGQNGFQGNSNREKVQISNKIFYTHYHQHPLQISWEMGFVSLRVMSY